MFIFDYLTNKLLESITYPYLFQIDEIDTDTIASDSKCQDRSPRKSLEKKTEEVAQRKFKYTVAPKQGIWGELDNDVQDLVLQTVL